MNVIPCESLALMLPSVAITPADALAEQRLAHARHQAARLGVERARANLMCATARLRAAEQHHREAGIAELAAVDRTVEAIHAAPEPA